MRFGLIVVLFLFTACASVHVETFNKTTGAKECEAQYTSWFKSLEGVKMQACHAKGEAIASRVDVDAIQMAISAMASILAGMAK